MGRLVERLANAEPNESTLLNAVSELPRTMVNIRRAKKEDCEDLARLFLISSDGFGEYMWKSVRRAGETFIEVGTRQFGRECADISYENCLIAELDGASVGMAHSYLMKEDPAAEPVCDPVISACEMADYGSLYLLALAVLEPYRNGGIGTRLMRAVNQRARDLAVQRISLICYERNEAAMRFYARLGFQEVERRAVYPHPYLRYQDGDAVLLSREIRMSD